MENCEAKVALDVQTNNITIYGPKHKSKCGKDGKDFYQCQLLKQQIQKLCSELQINQMKPLEVYKKAIGNFTNITITKEFKSQMLRLIRNAKFQHSKAATITNEKQQSQLHPQKSNDENVPISVQATNRQQNSDRKASESLSENDENYAEKVSFTQSCYFVISKRKKT